MHHAPPPTTVRSRWGAFRWRTGGGVVLVLAVIAAVAVALVQPSSAGVRTTAADETSGPRVDRQVITHQTTAATSISSAPLTTTQGDELILAFLTSEGGTSARQTFTSVSGGGLTWTLKERANAQRGTSEIWQASAAQPLSKLVVKATRGNGSYRGSIVVTSFVGADGTGAGRVRSAATGAPYVTVTTTRTGSWVWGVGNDGSQAEARTVGRNQTAVDQYLALASTSWVQRRSDQGSSRPGKAVTIRDSAPTDGAWNLAAVEVRPATGTTSSAATTTTTAAPTTTTPPTTTPPTTTAPTTTAAPTSSPPPVDFRPGNLDGTVAVPAGLGPADVSKPDQVVGNGTASSCTSAAVSAAVAAGGVVTFSCGPDPVTIALSDTLKVSNGTTRLVLDGGGLVTLSGGGGRRILYIDTCDTSLGGVSGNCLYAPDGPDVTVQNLTFADGNATNATYESPGDSDQGSNGGGAIFALGGHLKVVQSVFTGNVCASNGPDLGGGAIRVLAQHSDTPNDLDASYAARNQDPVAIVQSTFTGNSCSNGGAISTLRTPSTVINTLITGNSAVGCCSNPAKDGTPGGGSGGAMYGDGTSYDMRISGSRIEGNTAKAGGSAIFFVSNDLTGHLVIDRSVSRNNTYAANNTGQPQSFENYPGIFYLGDGDPVFTNSTIQ